VKLLIPGTPPACRDAPARAGASLRQPATSLPALPRPALAAAGAGRKPPRPRAL